MYYQISKPNLIGFLKQFYFKILKKFLNFKIVFFPFLLNFLFYIVVYLINNVVFQVYS